MCEAIVRPKDKIYELHRFLAALLSSELSVSEKLDVLEEEFEIPEEHDIREDVKYMCNLSQGIKEKGREEGREEGRENEIYLSVRDGDYSIQRGMQKLNIRTEEIFRKNAAERGFMIP